VAFSLGTDTAGSGWVPAALNAIVGLKPSLGLLSSSGHGPGLPIGSYDFDLRNRGCVCFGRCRGGQGFDAVDFVSSYLFLPKSPRAAVL